MSVDHVLTIFSGKIPATFRGTPTNSLVFLNTSSRCEMSRSDSWERTWVVVQSVGQPGVQAESVWITWPQSLVHRHWCFQDEQARYVLQRSWKCSCTDTWRRQTKWFCRWIVVFVMCAHETSYVYSYECVKSSSDIVFWWQPSPLASYPCFLDRITGMPA